MSGLRKSELADALGLSRPMIGKYAAAGMPFNEGGRITLAAAKKWISRNVQKPNTSESFQEARARKEQALASLRELEFKQKVGELVDVADVERTWCGVVMIMRQRLLALPTKCAPLMVGADAATAYKVLEDEVFEILTEFSQTEVIVESAVNDATEAVAAPKRWAENHDHQA